MKIISIVGARPQFIKAASVSRAFESHNRHDRNPRITEILVHTGQHYDHNMSQIFFDQLEIPQPQYNLGVGSGNHGEMTGKMLGGIERVLLAEKPDWVLVYGDTNSTLAGALAAVKLHIPVAHIEAGLRSFNRFMPEEINRVLTDHISTILFCPTETAINNLKNEGFNNIFNPTNEYSSNLKAQSSESRIENPIDQNNPVVVNVGDVMYDAFLFNKELSDNKTKVLSELKLGAGSYCLGTVHRQENTEDSRRLLDIFGAFEEISNADCPFVILLHPRTKKALQRLKKENRFSPHVRLLSPSSYLDMIALEADAKVILTDSGGVQKEAYFAKVPCVTLRDETEWIETVEAGWNHLGGANTQKIVEAFQEAADSRPNGQPNFYGNGEAAKLIVKHLISASDNE